MTLEELKTLFINKEIIGFKTRTNKKYRLFLTESNSLCYYKTGSSRSGYLLLESDLNDFKVVLTARNDNSDSMYTMIKKYRREALKASFTNDFIQNCLQLPETKEQWIIEGRKSLYEYNITTGNKIDGVVISFESIAKQYPWLIEDYKRNFERKVSYSSSRYRFRNYDLTLSVSSNNGVLSKDIL